MKRPVSPAAAAAISRLLQGAGITRTVEIAKGIELEGFYAATNGDHVRVEFVAGPFADDPLAIVEEGLARCFSVLYRHHYNIEQVEADVAYPGGMRRMPVLEVRKDSWTER